MKTPRAARCRTLLVLLGLCAVALPGGLSRAQQSPARLDVVAIRVEERQLTLSIAVLDGASNPVPGLQSDSFRLSIDGAAVAPGAVSTGLDAALPLGIVLAVDTSGSMQGASLTSARQAILPLVNAMQANDQAALLTFAQAVNVAVPLTGETGTLAAAINAMTATGNTALFAGVVRASELAAAAPQPRRAVVLLSDGEDFGAASGGITRERALEAARAAGVPFFVVGLGQEVDQQFLTGLASTTNGQYFAATDPAQLSGLYARISDRLRQQYTVVVPLPANLAGGSHRITVTAGGVTGAASFETAGPPPRGIEIDELPGELTRETVVSVSGAPTGATVEFALDGKPIDPLPGGRSIRLDPYALDPATPHTLTVRVPGQEPLTRTFRVAALPPLLVAPREIPGLQPGDLLRLTLTAQPGPVNVTFFADSREVQTLQAPPFEFIVPEDGFEPGDHQVRVVIANAAGSVEAVYGFTTPGRPGPNYAAYALLALAVAVVFGGGVYGAGRAIAWYRARPRPIDVSGVGSRLAEWAELRRGRGEEPQAAAPANAPGPWGRLTVAAGPDAGRVFELRDEVELVGRGSFCSIRLSDPAVEPAHFVISRDGRLNASTPTAKVEVDGAAIHSALAATGARIRIGTTELLVEGPA